MAEKPRIIVVGKNRETDEFTRSQTLESLLNRCREALAIQDIYAVTRSDDNTLLCTKIGQVKVEFELIKIQAEQNQSEEQRAEQQPLIKNDKPEEGTQKLEEIEKLLEPISHLRNKK